MKYIEILIQFKYTKGDEGMLYVEEVAELFERGKGMYLAHCISNDFVLDEGIAKNFGDMGVTQLLEENSLNGKKHPMPCCIETTAGKAKNEYKGVFNLVTKEKYWEKSTYEAIRVALCDMRNQIEQKRREDECEINVCMPLIGSGFEGLAWAKIRDIITEVFLSEDILIIVCRLTPEEW